MSTIGIVDTMIRTKDQFYLCLEIAARRPWPDVLQQIADDLLHNRSPNRIAFDLIEEHSGSHVNRAVQFGILSLLIGHLEELANRDCACSGSGAKTVGVITNTRKNLEILAIKLLHGVRGRVVDNGTLHDYTKA